MTMTLEQAIKTGSGIYRCKTVQGKPYDFCVDAMRAAPGKIYLPMIKEIVDKCSEEACRAADFCKRII